MQLTSLNKYVSNPENKVMMRQEAKERQKLVLDKINSTSNTRAEQTQEMARLNDILAKGNIGIQEVAVPGLSYKVNTADEGEKLLGGVSQKLKVTGHGVAYVNFKRGEDISQFTIKLTGDQSQEVKLTGNQNKLELACTGEKWSSESIDQQAVQALSKLCTKNNQLTSDQRFWVLVDSNNSEVKIGFGEQSDKTTLHKIKVDKAKIDKLHNIEVEVKNNQNKPVEETVDRLISCNLAKGGAKIVPDGTLDVKKNEIKEVDLPDPVKKLMTEMRAVEKEIESEYGNDIWKNIQKSLDSGMLKEIVEKKKMEIAQNKNVAIKENQVYVRVGFGDNYKGGPGHRMVIELWPAGHESPVHQHSSSYSYIKIMDGEVENYNYPILSECEIGKTVIAKEVFKAGDQTWLSPEQNQVHKIENRTKQGVISFHGYRYGDENPNVLTGVFDLIDKNENVKEGSAVVSHWDAYAKEWKKGEGIKGFLGAIKAEATGDKNLGKFGPAITAAIRVDEVGKTLDIKDRELTLLDNKAKLTMISQQLSQNQDVKGKGDKMLLVKGNNHNEGYNHKKEQVDGYLSKFGLKLPENIQVSKETIRLLLPIGINEKSDTVPIITHLDGERAVYFMYAYTDSDNQLEGSNNQLMYTNDTFRLNLLKENNTLVNFGIENLAEKPNPYMSTSILNVLLMKSGIVQSNNKSSQGVPVFDLGSQEKDTRKTVKVPGLQNPSEMVHMRLECIPMNPYKLGNTEYYVNELIKK